MKICIIQARMASSRLPGKVLLDIAGKPMLQWVVERARLAETVDEVVVATTTDASDDPVAAFCAEHDILFTRGPVHDVLDRCVQAARRFGADIVVRLTADCPLIDPALIDETVELLYGARSEVDDPAGREGAEFSADLAPRTSHLLDFTANRLPPPWGRTYPIGLDVEAAAMSALERAWTETSEKHHREHVMPYFYDDLPPGPLEASRIYTTPRGFRVAQLHHADDHGSFRWTVDTPADLQAVRAFAELLPATFTWLDALEIWQAHPEIAAINAAVPHKTAKDVDHRNT